jgi:hypothetical protein
MAPHTLKQTSQTITTIHPFTTSYPSSPLLLNPRPPSLVCTFLSYHSVGMGAMSPIIACTCTLTHRMPHAIDHSYLPFLSQSHSHSRSHPCSCSYINNHTEARDSPSHALTHTLLHFECHLEGSHMHLHAQHSHTHTLAFALAHQHLYRDSQHSPALTKTRLVLVPSADVVTAT